VYPALKYRVLTGPLGGLRQNPHIKIPTSKSPHRNPHIEIPTLSIKDGETRVGHPKARNLVSFNRVFYCCGCGGTCTSVLGATNGTFGM
jgi:hypothetical protein